MATTMQLCAGGAKRGNTQAAEASPRKGAVPPRLTRSQVLEFGVGGTEAQRGLVRRAGWVAKREGGQGKEDGKKGGWWAARQGLRGGQEMWRVAERGG